LFRQIWRLPPRTLQGNNGKPGSQPLPDWYQPDHTDSIARIVENWTDLIGFDTAAFAGHSLRR
jgi:hypothetical protein